MRVGQLICSILLYDALKQKVIESLRNPRVKRKATEFMHGR